ncbi:uncharacterized protein LOC128224427 isoform X2 [Mya arenaria]|uniref:uncharacterized protein LOC128224427 isoform X1 n=1 Tax=Mya arenaria TaxID=6604 RepID=UPI0022E98A4F|nr:uncharacterized protein LOC128224427 isoform X1 [Mya arenaria]XP_052790228.1 uncharacterized protein LOC128224427 isoform X2 [Mya arenaria]
MDFIWRSIILLSCLSYGQSSGVNTEQSLLNALGFDMNQALSNLNSATRNKRDDEYCALGAILNRINSCPAHTQLIELLAAQKGGENVDMNLMAEHLCKDSECTIRCFTEAIGRCHQADEYFFVSDPVTRTVAHRAMCDRKHNFAEFISNCGELLPKQCVSGLVMAVLNLTNTFNEDNNSTKYRIDGCRAYSEYKTCFKVPITDKCIAADASYFEDLAIASTSFMKCNDQSHHFFSKYGADVQCGDEQYQRYLTGTAGVYGLASTPGQTDEATSNRSALILLIFVVFIHYLF